MKATYTCACCGEEIYFDEDCYDIGGVIYCRFCVEECRLSAPMPEAE